MAIDGLLAAFFAVLAQLELHLQFDDGYKAGPLWLNSPLQVLVTLPLLLRSCRPRLGLMLMVLALGVPSLFVAHTLLFWGNFLPLLILNYTVARRDAGWLGRWSWLACTAVVELGAIHLDQIHVFSDLPFPLVMFAATSGAGRLVRKLSTQRLQLSQALAQLAAEQGRREESAVEGAVTNERGRIAGEMHDVVAHAVSLMVVQVGAARMKLGEAAPAELRSAEDTGRQALAELRRTLGLLRHSEGALQPLPDLSAVDELVSRCRAAGVEVHIDRDEVGELPPSVQLAAYRVLQEALTNVVKHAGAVSVEVSVRRTRDSLELAVRNDPGTPTSPTPRSGHGIAGMRERISMFGGTLQAGPDAAGGFLVLAQLPLCELPHEVASA